MCIGGLESVLKAMIFIIETPNNGELHAHSVSCNAAEIIQRTNIVIVYEPIVGRTTILADGLVKSQKKNISDLLFKLIINTTKLFWNCFICQIGNALQISQQSAIVYTELWLRFTGCEIVVQMWTCKQTSAFIELMFSVFLFLFFVFFSKSNCFWSCQMLKLEWLDVLMG